MVCGELVGNPSIPVVITLKGVCVYLLTHSTFTLPIVPDVPEVNVLPVYSDNVGLQATIVTMKNQTVSAYVNMISLCTLCLFVCRCHPLSLITLLCPLSATTSLTSTPLLVSSLIQLSFPLVRTMCVNTQLMCLPFVFHQLISISPFRLPVNLV